MSKLDPAKLLGAFLAVIAITAVLSELHGRVIGRDQVMAEWYSTGCSQ